ncbi:MAG: MBL fold metallo-hydrolase [Ignavibacteriaceae bacterium]|nr:MBL fold metallo-hydrolase [Ignavibacteriaceae bacterium]
MQIGDYKLTAINSGYFRLDGGAMFGIIPKPLWERTNPPDSMNRIKLSARNLLLQKKGRNILIDTGMGNKWDEKSRSIYDIDQGTVSLQSELKKIGLLAEDITDVILTHLHFDHTGGSTIVENGKLVPTFQSARYYVQKQNLDWAMNSTEKDKGSYIKDNFMPLVEFGVLDTISGDTRFDKDIEFIVVNGHTFGQQLIKISDMEKTLLYCCDMIPTASHIPLPYIMGYDLQPLVTLSEKKNLLQKAADEKWLLFFEHDPDTIMATVAKTEKGYKAENRYNEL